MQSSTWLVCCAVGRPDNFTTAAHIIPATAHADVLSAAVTLGDACLQEAMTNSNDIYNHTSTGWSYDLHEGEFGTNYLLRAGDARLTCALVKSAARGS